MTDLNDLVKSKRFEEIHDSRMRVLQQERKAADGLLEGEIDQLTANMVIRRAVENYIYEVENLVKPPSKKTNLSDKDYWNDVELGEFELPDGQSVKFEGLKSVLEAPNPFVVQTTERRERPLRGETKETVTHRVQIPRSILMNAYRQVNTFLAEIGMEIDPTDDQTETWHFREITDQGSWDASDGGKA